MAQWDAVAFESEYFLFGEPIIIPHRLSSNIYCFFGVMALISPLFQPHLINPNVISFYTIPFFFTLWMIAFIVKQNNEVLITSTTAILFSLMAALVLLSLSLSNSFALILFFSCIVFIVFSQPKSHPYILFGFLVSSAVFSSLALFVWVGYTNGAALHFGLWELTTDARVKPGGPFVNGNVLAIVNSCAWLLSAAYALKTKQWRWWLLAFFFLCCVSISMAWGAWLAMLPLIIWFLTYYAIRKNYRAVLALLFSILVAWNAGQAVVEYVTTHDSVGTQARIKNVSEHGIEERKMIWLATYKMWQEHPWFGVGLGHMSAHYLTYQSKVLAESKSSLPEQVALNSAHDLLLQLMAEAGVFGLLLWLSITIWLFILSWRYRMRIATSRVWPALGCAWLLWIQGMGNITMSRPYPMLMFALFLGIASAPSLRLSMAKYIRIKKHFFILILLLLAPIFAWEAVEKTEAWLDYERLMFSDNTTAKEKAKLTQSLVTEPSVLPYLIADLIGDRLLKPESQQSVLLLEPYLQQALRLREDPRLLEQQFYIHALNKRWGKACDIATILIPMKAEEKNKQAYMDACNKKMPKDFSLY
ncbi:MAG: O-antigen ligase family protein [Mariprofundaceae bacterium]|nr:O-antigen ligase family protein [Mariprofundaceae bacterium]